MNDYGRMADGVRIIDKASPFHRWNPQL